MANLCKLCGSGDLCVPGVTQHPNWDDTLPNLYVEEFAPDWAASICRDCFGTFCWDFDRETTDHSPVYPSEDDFNIFATKRLGQMSKRLVEGRGVYRCENVPLVSFRDIKRPSGRCGNFAEEEIDGHRVCRSCIVKVSKRKHQRGLYRWADTPRVIAKIVWEVAD